MRAESPRPGGEPIIECGDNHVCLTTFIIDVGPGELQGHGIELHLGL
jgi:hypothetical protein